MLLRVVESDWTMVYDLTQFNSTNARTYLDMTVAVNTASGGVFGALLLFLIFFFFLVVFNKQGYSFGVDNFIASSFLTTIFGVLLFLLGLVAWFMLMIPISLLIILFIIKFIE